jgi:hypothetical protein
MNLDGNNDDNDYDDAGDGDNIDNNNEAPGEADAPPRGKEIVPGPSPSWCCTHQ